MTTRLVVVIVHFRDSDSVVQLLGEMQSWSLRPEVAIIVDNSAGTPERFSSDDLPDDSDLHVVVVDSRGNPGYGAAMNLGLQRAADYGYQCALLLTQDARLEPEALARMEARMEPDVAVVGPLLCYRSDPSLVFSAGGALAKDGRATHLDRCSPRESLLYFGGTDVVRQVAWVDGACLLVRLSTMHSADFFDPAYFLYVEEVDLQYRVRQLGFRVVVALDAVGYQEPGNYRLYLKYRNHVYFSSKYSELSGYPWRRELFKDWVRLLTGRIPRQPWRDPLRGVRDARQLQMGKPR